MDRMTVESYAKKRRRQKDDVQVGRSALRDKNLSLKAKGLLAIFMSLDDDEEALMEFIQTLSTGGKDAHRAAINELEKHGYVVKRRLYNHETKRFAGWEYMFDDVVWVEEEERIIHTNKQKSENPTSGKKAEIGKSDFGENGPKTDLQKSENPTCNQRDLKDDLNKDDLIDRVHNILIIDFPELTKDTVESMYTHCLQYSPSNMEKYIEKALRSDLTKKKRKKNFVSKKAPVRVEQIPDWLDEHKKEQEMHLKKEVDIRTHEDKQKELADILAEFKTSNGA